MVTAITQILALAAGTAAGWAWPRTPGLPRLRRDTWINLAHGALLYPVRLALGWLGIHALRGAVPLDAVTHPAAQFLLVFVVLDLTRWLVHFADHRVPWLWSFHRVHHSTEALDATAGLRMHLVDFLQLSAIPVVLFGVLLDVSSFAGWVVPAALCVGIMADAIAHADVPFSPDTPWKRAWFACAMTPLFHAWHHTREGARIDGNYASALPLWDRLFGTDVTRPHPPDAYGLDATQALRNDVVGLQLLRARGETA
ncbi:MAG: hypothetical protein RLZZ299_2964 [Pseudomonadota bacterium]|jgi:lathosterol oxidase